MFNRRHKHHCQGLAHKDKRMELIFWLNAITGKWYDLRGCGIQRPTHSVITVWVWSRQNAYQTLCNTQSQMDMHIHCGTWIFWVSAAECKNIIVIWCHHHIITWTSSLSYRRNLPQCRFPLCTATSMKVQGENTLCQCSLHCLSEAGLMAFCMVRTEPCHPH